MGRTSAAQRRLQRRMTDPQQDRACSVNADEGEGEDDWTGEVTNSLTACLSKCNNLQISYLF